MDRSCLAKPEYFIDHQSLCCYAVRRIWSSVKPSVHHVLLAQSCLLTTQTYLFLILGTFSHSLLHTSLNISKMEDESADTTLNDAYDGDLRIKTE